MDRNPLQVEQVVAEQRLEAERQAAQWRLIRMLDRGAVRKHAPGGKRGAWQSLWRRLCVWVSSYRRLLAKLGRGLDVHTGIGGFGE